MKAITFFGAVLAGLLVGAQPALSAGAGTTAAEFLRFGVGQPAFMSDASGSCQQGATALYWNPAGLGGTKCMDAYAAHYGLPETVSYDFAGFVLPVRSGLFKGGLGLSLQMLNQGDMTRVDNTGAPTGNFSAGDFASGVAWGGLFGPVRGGLGFRYIRQSIDNQSGSVVALDAGVQKDLGRGSVGAAITNLGSSLKVGSKAFELPTTLRMGATFNIIERLTLALDQSVSKGLGMRFHGGVLFKVAGPVSIGAGYTTGQGKDGPSGLAAGMRLSWDTFVFDTSYRPFGDLGNAVQVGLGLRFSCPRSPDASPAPVDSDDDGIFNLLDQCPGTPAGIVVDARGCFPDADSDGVSDSHDKCPGTPTGAAVDAVGCAPNADADADGVPDSLDKCSGTPAGIVVDTNGCVPVVDADTDSDGVSDSLDKCPGTLAGIVVDTNGCVPVVDTDADGVPDSLDKCPGTPAAIAVDAAGCPSGSLAEIQALESLIRLAAPGSITSPIVDAVRNSAADPACPWDQAGMLCQLVMGFDYEKAELKADFASRMKAIAVFMKTNPGARLELQGYTDDHGTDEYDLNLSRNRAEAVMKHFVEVDGLEAGRLSAKGMGKVQPVAPNETEEGRASNRRVIAVLSVETP